MPFVFIVALIMGIAGGSIIGATAQQKADKLAHMKTVRIVFPEKGE